MRRPHQELDEHPVKEVWVCSEDMAAVTEFVETRPGRFSFALVLKRKLTAAEKFQKPVRGRKYGYFQVKNLFNAAEGTGFDQHETLHAVRFCLGALTRETLRDFEGKVMKEPPLWLPELPDAEEEPEPVVRAASSEHEVL